MSETPNVENQSEAVEADAATETAETTEATEAAATDAAETDAAPAEIPAAADNATESSDEEEVYVEPTTYRVTTRSEEEVIDGRIEAVNHAKEISIETGQSVTVERTDGRVKMSFRDGSLVDYVLETRKGRRA